jgi:ketosteroid isomerase-like protein
MRTGVNDREEKGMITRDALTTAMLAGCLAMSISVATAQTAHAAPAADTAAPAATKEQGNTCMEAEKNKKIVKATWDAFWRGDIEAGVANMSDDITWFTQGDMKMAGTKVGKDAIRKFRFTELDVFKDLKRDVVGVYGDGNTVVMELKAVGHLRNGEPYENGGVVVYELDNGKIVRVRQYVDTQKAMALNALFDEKGQLKK